MRLGIYHAGLVLAAMAVFFTNLPDYVHHQNLAETLSVPKNWVIAFCLLSIPIVTRRQSFEPALRSPITLWCLGYVFVTVLWQFNSSQSEETWRELRLRVLSVVELLSVFMVLAVPAAIKFGRQCLVVAVLFGVVLNLYEVFYPSTFSLVSGRSAGLYMNPNLSGQALVLGMVLSMNILSGFWRMPFILLTGVGAFATFSRASILGWLIAVVGMLMCDKVRLREMLSSLGFFLVVGALVIIPQLDQWLTTWERTGTMNADVLERLEWLSNPFEVSDHSSWSRATVAREAWSKFTEASLFGIGTGSTHDMVIEPHNQYLALMVDHGIIGAIILPLLLFALAWNARGETRGTAFVFSATVLVLGVWTHSILRDEHSLVLFSLMAAMTFASRAVPVASFRPGMASERICLLDQKGSRSEFKTRSVMLKQERVTPTRKSPHPTAN